MLDRFRRHLERSRLIPPDARVLVGYSGGADSTCLLHLLAMSGANVVAAHLHHGQRPEADKEMALCEAFCGQLSVPFVGGRADVPLMSRELKIGLEEAGREARYGFFQRAAVDAQCSLIATAHTRSDHVETVLLNLVRGSGLAGVSGIPERRGSIVRPLLIFSREETRAYCDERGLWYHDDPANEDVAFSRARLRLRVLPELRALNPAADEAIARLAALAGEEDRFLNGMAAAALEQAETHLNGDLRFLSLDVEAAFRKSALEMLPLALFRRGMRLAVSAVGGNLTAEQAEALAASVPTQSKGSITAEGGQVAVEWDEDLIHVRQVAPATPFRYGLTVPGETASREFGWQLAAFEQPYSGAAAKRAALEAELDSKKLKGQLYFRTASAGDTMTPFGFEGRRKLSDMLSEAKLTRAARSRLPIVCDMVGPVWAPGVCLDARVAPDSSTRNVLLLRFGPMKDQDSHNLETWDAAKT